MRVPLLDLVAQYEKIKTKIDDAVARVLKSGRYVLGPEVQAFESELGSYLGGGGEPMKVVAVASGTDALLSAAMALDIGLGSGRTQPGLAPLADGEGEVLTTAYSFFATPETAVRLGCRPVFADIEENGYNADLSDMLGKVGKKTRAIIPVHLFGQRMSVAELVATGVPVLEDAAQTLVPGIGEKTSCATLSFFPSKNLGAAGDAGAVVTRDAALHDALTVIRQHGSKPKYVHALWGGNFRMDPIQAAILRVKLKELPEWQAQRRKNAARYHAQLSELCGSVELRLPPSPDAAPEHAYHHYVIRAPRRDALRAFLSQHGVESEVYYPMPLHLQPCFAYLGYRPGSLPRAEAACKESLAIPVHADLSVDQLDHVVDKIRDFYKSA
jgi:dTDP-4-amino-4,6-dideoxygalactose transaminase